MISARAGTRNFLLGDVTGWIRLLLPEHPKLPHTFRSRYSKEDQSTRQSKVSIEVLAELYREIFLDAHINTSTTSITARLLARIRCLLPTLSPPCRLLGRNFQKSPRSCKPTFCKMKLQFQDAPYMATSGFWLTAHCSLLCFSMRSTAPLSVTRTKHDLLL